MKKQNVRTLCLILATFTYLVIGALVFQALELQTETVKRATVERLRNQIKKKYNISDQDYDTLEAIIVQSVPHKAGFQWEFAGAFYFSTTVITTIGYGHSTPSTVSGKAFCMFYALAGIPLGLVVFQSIGERLNTFVASIITASKQSYTQYSARMRGEPRVLINKLVPEEVSQTHLILVASTIGTLVITSGAYAFHKYENWSYFDSIYYCFITLTTIGFGDFVAMQKDNALHKSPQYVVFSLIFILFGLTVISAAMNLLVLRFLTMNTADEKADKKKAKAAQKAAGILTGVMGGGGPKPGDDYPIYLRPAGKITANNRWANAARRAIGKEALPPPGTEEEEGATETATATSTTTSTVATPTTTHVSTPAVAAPTALTKPTLTPVMSKEGREPVIRARTSMTPPEEITIVSEEEPDKRGWKAKRSKPNGGVISGTKPNKKDVGEHQPLPKTTSGRSHGSDVSIAESLVPKSNALVEEGRRISKFTDQVVMMCCCAAKAATVGSSSSETLLCAACAQRAEPKRYLPFSSSLSQQPGTADARHQHRKRRHKLDDVRHSSDLSDIQQQQQQQQQPQQHRPRYSVRVSPGRITHLALPTINMPLLPQETSSSSNLLQVPLPREGPSGRPSISSLRGTSPFHSRRGSRSPVSRSPRDRSPQQPLLRSLRRTPDPTSILPHSLDDDPSELSRSSSIRRLTPTNLSPIHLQQVQQQHTSRLRTSYPWQTMRGSHVDLDYDGFESDEKEHVC